MTVNIIIKNSNKLGLNSAKLTAGSKLFAVFIAFLFCLSLCASRQNLQYFSLFKEKRSIMPPIEEISHRSASWLHMPLINLEQKTDPHQISILTNLAH